MDNNAFDFSLSYGDDDDGYNMDGMESSNNERCFISSIVTVLLLFLVRASGTINPASLQSRQEEDSSFPLASRGISSGPAAT
jgi:hypothetical protein